MQGNVVEAARWLGGSLVLASLILVGGVHWTLKAHDARLAGPTRDEAEALESSKAEVEAPRKDGDDRERASILDRPSHMTPFRTHGGLGP